MKRSSKLYITLGLAAITSMSACRKGFESMNQPWEEPSSTNINTSFNSILSTLDLPAQELVTYNEFIYPATQLGMISASSGYHLEDATKDIWKNYYYALIDARLMEKMIAAEPDQSRMKNVTAMLKIIMAYKTLHVSDFFGNMPYSEAGKAADGTTKYRVAFDKQNVIYEQCLADLKWAVDNLSSDASQVSYGAYDTFLKGDINRWRKFANSLRLRYAVRMSEVNATAAQTIIAEALTKPLLEDGEDVGYYPQQMPGLTFIWKTWAYSGTYLRLGTTMWKMMSDNNNTNGSGIFDPRCKVFFEPNEAGQWVPYPQNPTSGTTVDGARAYVDAERDKAWGNKAGAKYALFNYYMGRDNTTMPQLFITAAEVHFLKAEIYLRGLGAAKNAGAAKTEYDAGVKSSVTQYISQAIVSGTSGPWVVSKITAQPTTTEMNTFMTNPKVAFNTANEAAALKQIYAQSWINFFTQPGEAWALQRRTNNATPMETDNASYYGNQRYGKLKRFPYPADEANYNYANWYAETGGNDLETNKVWWQK
ncbi:SusD-like starch-binding protein associating with outer membrane [Chitinophaga skermanii]|uniref:SusD-like starch-binding protein associating with outer membrane n=1 Tax=Chitinophaga skermanii TaxID=331697 RepID=A0A327QY92_9BACT|nr:SusD/RagB family nutrient-binding outer membrane lipoprotein [Chitinophaga skermanii]RAJ06647.1 SusD-like starch-binding protein associating with outer membrane [Chitinophaga skermanii]